jgi:hypothetical protein
MCGCVYVGLCNVWVCVCGDLLCMGVLIVCVLEFTVFCIFCTLMFCIVPFMYIYIHTHTHTHTHTHDKPFMG